MNNLYAKRLLIFFGGIIAVSIFIYANISNQIYLYAWERPEDLSFLGKNSDLGVVFYSGGIVIDRAGVKITPRVSSLKIPSGVESFPLIRVDNLSGSVAALESAGNGISSFISDLCRDYKKCQIDFEARPSEYEFYKGLLATVAKNIPKTRIAITGLASWCVGTAWFDQSPIDGVTPMLYRMGPTSRSFKGGATSKSLISNSLCYDSVALSVDELDLDLKKLKNKDIYFFNPKPWTESDYNKIRNLLK